MDFFVLCNGFFTSSASRYLNIFVFFRCVLSGAMLTVLQVSQEVVLPDSQVNFFTIFA